MLNVLVSSKHDAAPGGLECIQKPYELYISDTPGWAVAANELLDLAAEKGGDALFVDDDVVLTPSTFDLLERYYDTASVFGFTLVIPANLHGVQSAGYAFSREGALVPIPLRFVLQPCYVPHVTASCMYIKEAVLRAGLRFPVWPGVHVEDVAFTLDCWLRGFRVAYLPGLVEHHMANDIAGATKAHTPELDRKLAINRQFLNAWMVQQNVAQAMADGRLPVVPIPIATAQPAPAFQGGG